MKFEPAQLRFIEARLLVAVNRSICYARQDHGGTFLKRPRLVRSNGVVAGVSLAFRLGCYPW